jgi:hypothetical protein
MIVDRDNGAAALIARIRGLAKSQTLTVGVHASAGDDVVQRATFAEFGTSTEVPRSFLRAWADTHQDANVAALEQVAVDAARGIQPLNDGLTALGARFVGEIQTQMANEPADAPATVERKGNATPLVDSGELSSSITAEVEP